MGVSDPRLRQRLEAQVPFADAGALGAGAADAAVPPVAPLNAAARSAAGRAGGTGSADGSPTLLVCCDAGGGLGGLEPVLAALELPVFAVCLPEGGVEDAPADVAELALLGIKAARGVVPPGSRLLVAGEGTAWLLRVWWGAVQPTPCVGTPCMHPADPTHLACRFQASALAACWHMSWQSSWQPCQQSLHWRWRCWRRHTHRARLPPCCPGCQSRRGRKCARLPPRCTLQWRRPRGRMLPALRPLCRGWPAWRGQRSSWTMWGHLSRQR